MNLDDNKAIVLLSGGQDSTTCLFWAKKRFKEVSAITINYGQRHDLEIGSALKIAELAKLENHEIINLDNILQSTSPLVNSKKEVDQYEDADSLPEGLEATFVPGRNIIFLTLIANRAYALGIKNIIIGVSQEDFGGYFDCRLEFIVAMRKAINQGFFGSISGFDIIAPLITKTKKETVNLAVSLGDNCLEALRYSHTCYKGEFPPCGKCHACLLRKKGFDEAGVKDPIWKRKII